MPCKDMGGAMTGKLSPGTSGEQKYDISALPKTKGRKQVRLVKDEIVKITTDLSFANHCTDRIIYIDYQFFPVQAAPGMAVFISGGDIKLVVMSVEGTEVFCKVDTEGILKNYHEVNIPMIPLNLPAVPKYDVHCLQLAVDTEVDIVAISKVRNADTVCHVRRVLEGKKKGNNILLLAKISNYEGLRNLDSILGVADGIVIQRKDLAMEITPAKVFIAQKEIIGKCNRVGKPVICSTLILPSMVENYKPARAEISDVGYCIVDGSDCVALTSETASGLYPVDTILRLDEICREGEAATMQKPFFKDLIDTQIPAIEPKSAVAMAAVQVANRVRAVAILVITTSGVSARLLSWFRPRCSVLAICRVGKVARQLNLWRAVLPVHYTGEVMEDWFEDNETKFQHAITFGRDKGIIKPGDALVLVNGFKKGSGFTNCIRIVYATVKMGRFVESLKEFYSPPNQ